MDDKTQFDESVANLEAALERAGQLLRGPDCDLLVLDDINPLLDCGAIDERRVRELMEMMPESTSIVLTGHLRIRHQDESALSIARRQMGGFGGVLSFVLKGGFDSVQTFLPRLRYARLAANLGAVETVTGPPATTSHVECAPEQRKALGIPESLVRCSVGIEDAEDLIADLDEALTFVAEGAQ